MDNSKVLNAFCERPYVFTVGDNYTNYVNFLSGFMIGRNINDNFISFLKTRFNNNFSIHWSFYILNEIAQNKEHEAAEKLFSLVQEFAQKIDV